LFGVCTVHEEAVNIHRIKSEYQQVRNHSGKLGINVGMILKWI